MASMIDPSEQEAASLELVLQAVRDSHEVLSLKLDNVMSSLEVPSPRPCQTKTLPSKMRTSPAVVHPIKKSEQSFALDTSMDSLGTPTRFFSTTTQEFRRGSPITAKPSVVHHIRSEMGVIGRGAIKITSAGGHHIFFLKLKSFIRGPRFDFLMGSVILLNAVYIGLEIDQSIHQTVDTAPPLQYIFVFIYTAELSLRFWACGFRDTLENVWNALDVILVSCGLIALLVIEPIRQSIGIGQGADSLQQLVLVRLLRILRLVRSFRFFPQFKLLWGLVNGLLHALPAILSTFALLFLLIYIFACCAVEMVTKSESLQTTAKSDAALKAILDTHFDTLPTVALTLIRFTTSDSIADIYEPLTKEKPELILLWVLLLLVISITIMNLVTAVLVEHSLSMAKNDSELENHMRRKTIRRILPAIEDLFSQLDTNQDGQVSLQEAVNSHVHWPKELTRLVNDPSILVDLFEALDRDNSGGVEKDELVEGLLDLALSEVPVETIKLLNYSRVQKRKTRKMKNRLDQLYDLVVASMVSKRPMRNSITEESLHSEPSAGSGLGTSVDKESSVIAI